MSKETNGISSIGTVSTLLSRGACSDTACCVLNRAFGHPSKTEERASGPLAGGIMLRGYQCGMLWGATLAAGAQAYRLCGTGAKAETEAIIAADRLVKSFRIQNKHVNCSELTVPNMTSSKQVFCFMLKGGPIRCFRMAANYAPVAFSEINSSLCNEANGTTSSPASCSAMLAKKAGVSDMHAAMVAGFAGGIGLSGGGCGALGTAIWIIGMKAVDEGIQGNLLDQKVVKSKVDRTIDEFLKCSGHEMECSEIVGRKFENVGDHASHLRNGGCSKIIEALAEQCSAA